MTIIYPIKTQYIMVYSARMLDAPNNFHVVGKLLVAPWLPSSYNSHTDSSLAPSIHHWIVKI